MTSPACDAYGAWEHASSILASETGDSVNALQDAVLLCRAVHNVFECVCEARRRGKTLSYGIHAALAAMVKESGANPHTDSSFIKAFHSAFTCDDVDSTGFETLQREGFRNASPQGFFCLTQFTSALSNFARPLSGRHLLLQGNTAELYATGYMSVYYQHSAIVAMLFGSLHRDPWDLVTQSLRTEFPSFITAWRLCSVVEWASGILLAQHDAKECAVTSQRNAKPAQNCLDVLFSSISRAHGGFLNWFLVFIAPGPQHEQASADALASKTNSQKDSGEGFLRMLRTKLVPLCGDPYNANHPFRGTNAKHYAESFHHLYTACGRVTTDLISIGRNSNIF